LVCDPAIVAEVERLLAEGKLSQRAIARRLAGQISRGTIQKIAKGERRVMTGLTAAGAHRFGFHGAAERCPRCRRLFYKPLAGWPCQECRAMALASRSSRLRRRRIPASWERQSDLELRLTPEQQERRKEVRDRSVCEMPDPETPDPIEGGEADDDLLDLDDLDGPPADLSEF
jgi:hypothetical protein